MEEEEEEEPTKNRTNNELVDSAADNGARHDRGCGCRCAAAVAAIAAVAVRSGHVVSANLVQAYCSADVQSNKPTDVELRCMLHHLIDVADPPIVIVLVVVDDIVISYNTIFYGIQEAKYSMYDYFTYIRRKSIVQKKCTQ